MIAIIGAGISGLSTAWYLRKLGIPYRLYEVSGKAGGYIGSVREGDYLFETGPNTLLADTETEDFINELGLGKDMIEAALVSKDRFILKNNSYQKLPASPPALLTSSFFSFKTKVAVFTEFFRKPESVKDETLAAFVERRFSKELVDYAVSPFISGIYAGLASETDVEIAFPMLKEYENKYGSVLKGFIKNKSGMRKKTVSFRNGMQQLTSQLEQHVKDNIQFNASVTNIKAGNNVVTFEVNGTAHTADKIILCTTAISAAELLKSNYPSVSNSLNKITYSPIVAVHSIYKKQQVAGLPNGFGGLNPQVEKAFSLGSIWTGSIFPDRCPSDEFMFTTFVGGLGAPQKLDLTDVEILEKVKMELKTHFSISGEPVKNKVSRWSKAIPQYNKELKNTLAVLPALEEQGILFNVNWKGGIALPDRIKQAKKLAESLKK